MLTIRKACREDLTAVMQVFTEARLFLKEKGIPQWQDGTPNRQDFLTDIEQKDLFICLSGSTIIGIAALKMGPDPFYQVIHEGRWRSEQPYYAIHRVAFSDQARGQHLSIEFFQSLFSVILAQGISHVRIDTHPLNKSMLAVIKRIGFQYCGIIEVKQEQSDPIRKAFELKLK